MHGTPNSTKWHMHNRFGLQINATGTSVHFSFFLNFGYRNRYCVCLFGVPLIVKVIITLIWSVTSDLYVASSRVLSTYRPIIVHLSCLSVTVKSSAPYTSNTSWLAWLTPVETRPNHTAPVMSFNHQITRRYARLKNAELLSMRAPATHDIHSPRALTRQPRRRSLAHSRAAALQS